MGLLTVYQMLFFATVAFVVVAAQREMKRARSVATETETIPAPQSAAPRPLASYFQRPVADSATFERVQLLDGLLQDGIITGDEHKAIRGRILKHS